MPASSNIIRTACPPDASAVAEIYRPYVIETAISFETEPPTVAEMQRRMAQATPALPWLVIETGSRLSGYAYATQFRARPAYRNTVETTVYVDRSMHRCGIGKQLMEALLLNLKAAGHHLAIAGVTLPNPASVALHEQCGFRSVGVFCEAGRKFDEWHDVGFWSLLLSEYTRSRGAGTEAAISLDLLEDHDDVVDGA